jgi:hypothetical protein
VQISPHESPTALRPYFKQLELELTNSNRITLATNIVQNFFISSLKDTPLSSTDASSSFEVSMIEVLRNPKKLIQEILTKFMDVT